MGRSEMVFGKSCGGGDDGGVMNCGNSSDGFIDRSKVRILLCDNDAKSSEEVFKLLCKCSYQVTSVRSPRQVIDALNAEGPDIDIILSEVDLPMAKGLKMLKYITRDKELLRIPVIMMSAQDEVSLVVKCLRLGAADYLVKPLRTNELLNLWTHMWRRRRMLGLAEKNILTYDFDMVASDPSDANTNSTTLFSDDTDDKSRKAANPDMCMSTHQEDGTNVARPVTPVEKPLADSLEGQLDVQGTNQRRRVQISSCPRKSELKIGGSSAFFTYVKSSVLKSDTQVVVSFDENAAEHLGVAEKLSTWGGQIDDDIADHVDKEAQEDRSQGLKDYLPSNKNHPASISEERSCIQPFPMEFSQSMNSKIDEFPLVHMHQRNESHHGVPGFSAHNAYPFYIPGVINQVMMPSTASMLYQKNPKDTQDHAISAMLPHYNHIQHCPPHVPGMGAFPYYPVRFCLPPGQMPREQQPWLSHGISSSNEVVTLSKVDRREAALLKFRQKRKERCFDKKVRCVNRKKLSEKRPRVRGQFARKMNGLNVDLNGQPASADFDDDEEDDEEEESS